jgi:hypothetical protein
MLRIGIKSSVSLMNSLAYVVWDIVSGKIFRVCACSASENKL